MTYYCIRCKKLHRTSSAIGDKHLAYVPLFGGIWIPEEKVMADLHEWVIANSLQNDPEKISKIHDEVRRRFPRLITMRVSEIVEGTLRKAEG